ncbi:MAG TPA: hypothetical protein PKU83_02175, partial [Chryseolinea sp.]|nr:hypothetical protein [Chryseolinea sp.]
MVNVFSFLTPSTRVPQHLRQLVYITNILSLILSGLTIILIFILFRLFGWLATFKFIFMLAILFFLITFINRRNWNIGRLIFCLCPVAITVFVTLYGKTVNTSQSYVGYFDSRILLLAATILPGIVFKLKERLMMSICLAFSFVFLASFDGIHWLFGLDFYQRGFTAPSYYYINYITMISYFVLLFGVI